MLIVIIPVIILSIDFVYHYREKNHEKQVTDRKVEYKPNWSESTFFETLWWSIPCVIVLALAFISWHFTHKLDPYRTLNYPDKPVHVQVVSLPWKWLFIYPEYNIATVNNLVLPKDRQIAFSLSCDNVPMSSFIVPQLGSQIYTMAGMETKLHLIPTEIGSFRGLNAQWNGEGFSEMHFIVDVKEYDQFIDWTEQMQSMSNPLDANKYQQVRQPEIGVKPEYFSSVQPDLFHEIIHSYMMGLEHPDYL